MTLRQHGMDKLSTTKERLTNSYRIHTIHDRSPDASSLANSEVYNFAKGACLLRDPLEKHHIDQSRRKHRSENQFLVDEQYSENARSPVVVTLVKMSCWWQSDHHPMSAGGTRREHLCSKLKNISLSDVDSRSKLSSSAFSAKLAAKRVPPKFLHTWPCITVKRLEMVLIELWIKFVGMQRREVHTYRVFSIFFATRLIGGSDSTLLGCVSCCLCWCISYLVKIEASKETYLSISSRKLWSSSCSRLVSKGIY